MPDSPRERSRVILCPVESVRTPELEEVMIWTPKNPEAICSRRTGFSYRRPICKVDLSGAGLKKAILSEADLSGELNRGRPKWGNSQQANLSTSEWGTFGGADLYEANLTKADLSGATL